MAAWLQLRLLHLVLRRRGAIALNSAPAAAAAASVGLVAFSAGRGGTVIVTGSLDQKYRCRIGRPVSFSLGCFLGKT